MSRNLLVLLSLTLGKSSAAAEAPCSTAGECHVLDETDDGITPYTSLLQRKSSRGVSIGADKTGDIDAVRFAVMARSPRGSSPAHRDGDAAKILTRMVGGSYLTPVEVGGSTIMTVLDTGSSNLAFPGKGAQTCCENTTKPCGQVTPFYDNSGYKNGSFVRASFGTGGWSGEVYVDTVSFAGMKVPGMQFVSIEHNLVYGGVCFWRGNQNFGIMGLAYDNLANYKLDGQQEPYHPTTMSQLKDKGFPDSFSLRLCPAVEGAQAPSSGSLGQIAFGTPDQLRQETPEYTYPSSAFQWIELIKPAGDPTVARGLLGYYNARMLRACVEGYTCDAEAANLPSNFTLQWTYFDSGSSTAASLMVDIAHIIAPGLYQFAPGNAQMLALSNTDPWELTRPLHEWPVIKFTFQGIDNSTVDVEVPASIYLEESEVGSGKYTLSIDGVDESNHNVIGNPVLSQYVEIFDRASEPNRLGLAKPSADSSVCPCLNGRFISAARGCQCFPGWTGPRCADVGV